MSLGLCGWVSGCPLIAEPLKARGAFNAQKRGTHPVCGLRPGRAPQLSGTPLFPPRQRAAAPALGEQVCAWPCPAAGGRARAARPLPPAPARPGSAPSLGEEEFGEGCSFFYSLIDLFSATDKAFLFSFSSRLNSRAYSLFFRPWERRYLGSAMILQPSPGRGVGVGSEALEALPSFPFLGRPSLSPGWAPPQPESSVGPRAAAAVWLAIIFSTF